MPSPSRWLPRVLAGAAAFTLVAVGAVGPAFAHVTVNSDDAAQGGFAKLSFRVPNERDDATTNKLDVQFPASQPLGFVSVKPTPGWTFTTTKSKLATPIQTDDGPVTDYVSEIVWTAQAGSEIGDGQFQEFDVSVGPLPTAAIMEFKALQTYSDGQVVRWIEEQAPGAAEPDHPAPILHLAAAAADAPSDSAGATTATTVSATPTTAAAAAGAPTGTAVAAVSKSDVDSAKGVGIAGIVVGALGLLVGGGALMRSRRSA